MPEFDFGHFHIQDELGRGGMALVYRAVDTRNDETVALKILYPHLMAEENNIKRFQREAEFASRLKHQYIVPVIDFGAHNKQIYIAMKYMPGNSLAELFKKPRTVKIKTILRLLTEIASALDFAHEQGVIHRDLKLQNILLDGERHAHLSDFGIARLVDSTRLTATGQIAGTPMYMSPEQIRGKVVDYRSDIYSFSVMSYLMLTGYYPFTGGDALSIIHKHVKEFPPMPTDVNQELPEAINSVLLRGLMKDPKDRYDTSTEMVKALTGAMQIADLLQTTSHIDIRALNPIDSIEMDAVGETSNRIEPPRDPSLSTDDIQTADVRQPSDIQSGFQSGQGTVPSNNSRMGVFGMIFGLIGVGAIVILVVVLVTQNNNGDDTQAQINIAQTQIQREIELDFTATALMSQSGAEPTDDPSGRPTLPPTWTPTIESRPSRTQPPRPNFDNDVTSVPFDGIPTVIQAINGAEFSSGALDVPNRIIYDPLPYNTPVTIIGRSGRDGLVQIVTEDGIEGVVFAIDVVMNLAMDCFPVTIYPPGAPIPPPFNPPASCDYG